MNLWTFSNPENWLADKNQLFPCLIIRTTNAMNNFLHDFVLQKVLVNDKPTFHHNNQISVSQIDNIPEESPMNASSL